MTQTHGRLFTHGFAAAVQIMSDCVCTYVISKQVALVGIYIFLLIYRYQITQIIRGINHVHR